MGNRLQGKVAIVTGGGRGIGRGECLALAAEGAKVVVNDFGGSAAGTGAEAGPADQVVAEIKKMGSDAVANYDNVADFEAGNRMVQQALDSFGRLDILINNVGMNLLTPSTVDADVAAWRKIIDTNLTGPYLCARQAARAMRPRQAGKIVNLSSIAGRQAAPGMGIYGVAKAGLEMLTRVLAVELAPDNIQVNAVAPSMVKTGFSAPFWSNESLQAQIVAGIPAGRLAEPMDVVHPVLFLASDAAGYITGQTLIVDGGSTSAS